MTLDLRLAIGIQNPKAGGDFRESTIQKTVDYLAKSQVHVALEKTERKGHATEIVRDAWSKGHKDFICFGGDGTLFEMINGLFPDALYRSCKIAVIPCGTGNSFSKDFLQKELDISDKIIQKQLRPCDVVEVIENGKRSYWINIFSFGFTADVGALRNRYWSWFGTEGYIASVLWQLRKLSSRSYKMKVDGHTIETDSTFISISNTRYTGGNMKIAPDAKPDDGVIDVVDVGRMTKWELLTSFPKIFSGKHVRLPQVKTYRAKFIEFSFPEPLDFMIDGEIIRMKPDSMRVLSNAVYIYG